MKLLKLIPLVLVLLTSTARAGNPSLVLFIFSTEWDNHQRNSFRRDDHSALLKLYQRSLTMRSEMKKLEQTIRFHEFAYLSAGERLRAEIRRETDIPSSNRTLLLNELKNFTSQEIQAIQTELRSKWTGFSGLEAFLNANLLHEVDKSILGNFGTGDYIPQLVRRRLSRFLSEAEPYLRAHATYQILERELRGFDREFFRMYYKVDKEYLSLTKTIELDAEKLTGTELNEIIDNFDKTNWKVAAIQWKGAKYGSHEVIVKQIFETAKKYPLSYRSDPPVDSGPYSPYFGVRMLGEDIALAQLRRFSYPTVFGSNAYEALKILSAANHEPFWKNNLLHRIKTVTSKALRLKSREHFRHTVRTK